MPLGRSGTQGRAGTYTTGAPLLGPEDDPEMLNAWVLYREEVLRSNAVKELRSLRRRDFFNGYRIAKGIGVKF